MGVYFNPGNGSYTRARNSQIFIDKTGLIEYLKKDYPQKKTASH